MKIAHRLAHVKPSLTLAVTAKAAELKAQGHDIISFGAGEPDFNTPQPIIDAAKKALDEGKTKYTPVPGLMALRESIAKWYHRHFGVEASADEVIVATGGKQVLYNAMMSILNPGDVVLIPSPYWLSYPAIANLCGAEVKYIETTKEENFLLTAAQLDEALAKDPQALLVLNSPCNPTGQAYDADRLAQIADVLRRYPDVSIIWDNIYASLVYDGFKHVELTKIAPDLHDRVITTGGFSKSFAMTGWRLGLAIAHKDRIKAMSSIQSHSTSNATSFAQYGAIAALELDDSVIENMRLTFEGRKNIICEEIAKIEGISCLAPKGAFYVLLDCTKFCNIEKAGLSIHDDVELAKFLLEKGHVSTVPGSAFGAFGHLRLSFALDEKSIVEGIRRIGKALESLR